MQADRQLLHYQLGKKLGAGGMGVVYSALDTRLRRTVALKFLPEALSAYRSARERLLSEAQAAAQLDHPNIGTVHAVEEAEDGRLFIAMAWYAGKTLENRLIPLPTGEALSIATQIARGLECAHHAGVVHSDIKPANVLLTSEGVVKILDFGLAKLKEPGTLTQAGSTLGTMEYMSPEQVRGRQTDHRTDLWALGVMLYEMLTGVSPFRAPLGTRRDAAATILRVLSVQPEPPRTLHPELPVGVDEVVASALAKDANARYGSAQALLEDLEALRSGTLATAPTVLASASPRPTPPSPIHQNPIFQNAISQSPALQNLAPSPAATATPPHTLPTPLTPLVGRRDELALLQLYLDDPDCRMVTLLGLGGTGKTRLSVQAAREQVKAEGLFAGGVYFVALEALSSPSLIAASVAEALGLELQAAAPLEQVVRAIGEQPVLLILDNFEHLLEGGVALVAELAQSCPNLKLLVTSRARLDLLEEWTLPLQGLPYPEPSGTHNSYPSAEHARSFGAVELFARRAQRVQPGFSLDADTDMDTGLGTDTLAHVVTICQLVRGLPLGLELAAAWVRVMPCPEIAREIARNLDFLSTSAKNANERHRSVRAVFEHSWALLSPEAQRLLGRLAVFRGGFSKDAARRVAGAPLERLAEFVDSSLVSSTPSGRFEQHPLLHQYAREKLAADPEQRRVQDKHSDYYLDFLHQQGEKIRGAEQKKVLGAIEDELENIRTAWRWGVSGQGGQPKADALKRATEPLRVFFEQRGRLQEGIDLFAQSVSQLSAKPPPRRLLGCILVNQAWLTLRIGLYEQAERLATRGLDLLSAPLNAPAEPKGVILGLNTLGAVAGRTGNYLRAKPTFERALTLARKTGDQSAVAICLANLASTEQSLGNYLEAKVSYQRSLALFREVADDAHVVLSLNNLGTLLLSSGSPEEARPLLEEGLQLAKKTGVQRLFPFFLANLGQVAYKLGDYTRARSHYQEAAALVRESGETWFEGGLLAELGRTSAALSEPREAQRYLTKSLSLAWSLQDIPLTLNSVIYFAELYLRQKNPSEALELLRVALPHQATEQEDKELARALLKESKRQARLGLADPLADALADELLDGAGNRADEVALENIVARLLQQKSG